MVRARFVGACARRLGLGATAGSRAGAALAALLGVLTGCLHDDLVTCASGIACPIGLACDDAHATCVDPAQLTSCAGQPDRTPCLDGGACHDGVCLPIGCGNGRLDPDEACDDGNTASADGCSADCSSTETCGNGTVDPVGRELCDAGDLANHDGCDSRCTLEEPDWTPYVQRASHPPRENASYAYDSARERFVVFGGFEDVGVTRVGTTLEWDGVRRTWLDRTPRITPTARVGAGFAYDAAHGACVLFGGSDFSGVVGDTWLWDGEQWTLAVSGTGPSPRIYPAVAYDAKRRRVLLFGGRTGAGVALGDLWAWDGRAWTELHPATLPPRRERAMLAYDPIRDELILVGGSDNGAKNDVWRFANDTWTAAGTLPETRFGGALVWDGVRGGLVLLGNSTAPDRFWDGTAWTADGGPGLGSRAYPVAYADPRRGTIIAGLGYRTTDTTMIAELYERDDAGTWSALATSQGPGGRQGAMLAYDALRARVVLFGGYSGLDRGDTFELERGAWVVRATTGPHARDRGALVYDPVRARTVLWGGAPEEAAVWEWDGATWTSAAPAIAPANRQLTAMAYVPGVGTVMMGGDLFPTASTSDTWIWDGTAWTDVSSTTPGPRFAHAMTYDPVHDEVVLFGGVDAGARLGDTWTWTRAEGWTRETPAASPQPRSRATMVWDPVRRQVLLIGGQIASALLDEIWAWDGTTWTRVFTDSEVASGFVEAASAYDAGEGAVIIEGTSGTYRLQWRGTGADDACATGSDRDGDGLAGCADPDCWATCAPRCPLATTCADGPRCGDGACDAAETCGACPADCGACPAYCGDAHCAAGEATSCPGDCP